MKKIAVFFGGRSAEYQVSLNSTYAFINNIDYNKYDVTLIGISEQGGWYKYSGPIEAIKNNTWFTFEEDCSLIEVSLTNLPVCFKAANGERLDIDYALVLMHGNNGEDGRIQGLLELCNIEIIGCNTLSSAICMDKKKSHQLIENIGIKCAKSIVVDSGIDKAELYIRMKDLNYPLYIKPVDSGSSVGLSRIEDNLELEKAIEYALQYSDKVIVEEEIKGIEVGCSIIGNRELIVSEIDEVVLNGAVFDLEEKYTQNVAQIGICKRYNRDFLDKLKEISIKIYRELDCCGFARIDLFVDNNNEIIFNEVNTIPGMTMHSRFPKMFDASKIDYKTMVKLIIETK